MLAPMSASHPASTNHEPHHHHHHHGDHHQSQQHPSALSHGPISSPHLPTASETEAHQRYLSRLPIPSLPSMQRIALVQSRKERDTIAQRLGDERPELTAEQKEVAAKLIQRSYRGHRTRRAIEGRTLDPAERWSEAIRELEWRRAVKPRAKEESFREELVRRHREGGEGEEGGVRSSPSSARENWRRLGMIARRAGGDGDKDDDDELDDEGLTEGEKVERRQHRMEERMKRQEAAKMMDLQYFLEMVDLKHRYGSSLRTYHVEWKKSDTKENFFYWLDYGEGRRITVPGIPRDRLEREQVRYLSKEERMNYLVEVDHKGRLCWAKNGARIDTTTKYRDSVHGIVPYDDTAPAFSPIRAEADVERNDDEGSTSDSSDSETEDEHTTDDEATRAKKYATPEFDNAKGLKKIKHVSAAAVFNKLLRKSVRKNTWIFVADTNFRLYVGIKQSGSFQHSSFLSAGRISDAGLIKIKDGVLSKLSPLSGHYRPPVSNFRSFVHSLKDEGADMSHVSISRSYAVLVGLEAYVKTRRRAKKFAHKLADHRDKILSPEEVQRREEAERDKSESAQQEQRFLQMKNQAEEEDRGKEIKLLSKLHLGHRSPLHHATEGGGRDEVDIEKPGTGPENAIAPQGTRDEGVKE